MNKLRDIKHKIIHRKKIIGLFITLLAIILVIIIKLSVVINLISAILLIVINGLGSNNGLPSVIQNLGLTLLGILIPLSIAILTDLYQKKGSEKGLSELDLRVILDQVFRIKRLLVYGTLIIIPFVFWENYNGELRLVSLILSIIGISLVVRTIIDVYNWIRGNVYTYRFSYLKNLNKLDDLEIAWRSVWQSKDVDIRYEKDFFDVFSSKIDRILTKPKGLKNITTILNDFLNSLNNRSTFFIWNEELFHKSFEWNFIIWKFSWQKLSKKSEESTYSIQLLMITQSIIKKIGSLTFKEKFAFSTIFMKSFQNHVEANKSERISIENRERYYITDIFKTFYQVLFEFIEFVDYSEKDYMWSVFPNDWKVTKGNLVNKENVISKISLYEFMEWTQQRLSAKVDFDSQLNDLQTNLFPEVDPETWASILIFILSPYEPEHRVRSVVSVRRNFGYDLKSSVFAVSEGGLKKHLVLEKLEKDAKIKNAYELALLRFGNEFTEKNLNSYIQEVTELKYPDTSAEEHRRKEYKNIFEEMRKII